MVANKNRIIFRRTFHPVGHGAFFTEHIKIVDGKDMEKAFLNVVYDCGAATKGENVPSLIKKEIGITFEKEEHIDLLFISHFDEDHINGLEYLLLNTKMDAETYVVIPFRFPYIFIALDDSFPSLARFINKATQMGMRFLGIHGEGLNRTIENAKREESNGKVLQLGKNNLFTVWDLKTKQPLWYFYPFMNINVGSLQQKIEKAIKDSLALKDVDLDDPNVVIKFREELKKIYQTIGNTKNHITKINVNSLLMLSFPARNVIKDCISKVGLYTGYDYYFREMQGVCAYCGITCLYTGDSVINKTDLDMINRQAVSVMKCLSDIGEIHQFQIPHHGSHNSFAPSLFSDLRGKVLVTFVNGNPYRRWYRGYKDLTREAAVNNIPLYIISQNFHSRMDTVWWLC